MGTKYDRVDHDRIIKDYNEVKKLSWVAGKHSISCGLVMKVLTNNGVKLKHSKKTLINDINHNALIKRYKEVYNAITVAKEMGVSKTTVLKILHKNGVRISRIKYSDEQIINHYKKVGVLKTTCKDLSISDDYVRSILRKHNIQLINLRRTQIGDVFGKLTVTEIILNTTLKENRRRFRLKCECGNQLVRYSKRLTSGEMLDCGCLKLKEKEERRRVKEQSRIKNRIKRELEGEERRKIREEKLKNRKPFKPTMYVGAVKGRLTITDIQGKGKNRIIVAKCECGTIKKYKTMYQTLSCGCLQRERSTVHGLCPKKDKEQRRKYDQWKGMVRRCYDTKLKGYKDYGGRGIYVCDRWRLPNGEGCKNYINDIKNHIGERPSPEYSLDRIDNDGPYEISNVRWATRSTQNYNQRRYLKKKNKGQTEIDF